MTSWRASKYSNGIQPLVDHWASNLQAFIPRGVDSKRTRTLSLGKFNERTDVNVADIPRHPYGVKHRAAGTLSGPVHIGAYFVAYH